MGHVGARRPTRRLGPRERRIRERVGELPPRTRGIGTRGTVWRRGIQSGIPCTRPGQLSGRLATASAGELTHGTRPLDDATVYGAAAAALALLERGGIAHLAFSEWLHTPPKALKPPSTGTTTPVTKRDAGLQSQSSV